MTDGADPRHARKTTTTGVGIAVALVVVTLAALVLGGPAAGHSVGLFYSPPAVTDDGLYVTSADGHLYALNVAGEPRWTVDASAEITTPATAHEGTVLFGTADGRVLAVGEEGTVRWDRRVADTAVGSIAAGDGRVYASAGSGVVALHHDGTRAWTRSVDGFVAAPVVAGADGPYVGASRSRVRNGTLYALDAGGDVRWTRAVDAEIEQLAVGEETVYHTAADRVAATTVDGTERWTLSLSRVLAQPSVRGDTVVVGTVRGTVAAIEGGDVVWRYRSDLPVAPVLANETVYATTPRGVVAIEAGAERWTRDVGVTVLSPPTVGDGVYVGTQINRTYALAPNGSIAWVNRYSTTSADVPWTDGDGGAEFWNPRGSVTRVVGPDGSASAPATADPGLPLLSLAGGVVALSALLLAYAYRHR
jgi:outer membrane protein assembly factor BamB